MEPTIPAYRDKEVEKLIRDAEKLIADPYASERSVELLMRKLFDSNYIDNEVLRVYKLLELRWITLSRFEVNHEPSFIKHYGVVKDMHFKIH